MGNVSQTLIESLKNMERRAEVLNAEIAAVNTTIHNVKRHKEQLENNLRSIQRQIWRARENIILEEGLPKNVSDLRNKIIVAIKRSASKNITIAEKERLDKYLVNLKKEIVEICPHPFVLSYDGYGGSYIDEYSDRQFGFRRCVACGVSEQSESSREDVYKILIETGSRLVKRDLRHESKNLEDEVWGDVGIMLELFREAAGDMNLGVKPLRKKSAPTCK